MQLKWLSCHERAKAEKASLHVCLTVLSLQGIAEMRALTTSERTEALELEIL